jgi:hypothetical protein
MLLEGEPSSEERIERAKVRDGNALSGRTSRRPKRTKTAWGSSL